MGQQVQLPDGRVLEYPVEATQDQILNHARQWVIDNPLEIEPEPVPEPVVAPQPQAPEGYDYAARDEIGFLDRFGEQVGSGVSTLRGLGSAALEATGEGLGIESLEEFGEEGRKAFEKRSQEKEVQTIQFTDIRNLSDVGSWLTDTAGEQVPLMAPSLASGFVGAKVGAKIGGAVGAAFGGVGAIPGAFIGGTIGGVLGAFTGSLTLGVGETQLSIKEKDEAIEAPGAAFLGGTAIAALDSVLPGKIGGQLAKRFGADIAEDVAQRTLLKPVKREYLKAAGKNMAIEGVTEAMQEAIAEVTGVLATGQELDGAQLAETMINAGAAGALMGGTIGVGAERFKKTLTQKQIDESKAAFDKRQAEAQEEIKKGMEPEAGAPLQITYEESSFTTDSPEKVVDTIIDESVTQGADTGLGQDIGEGAPFGPFTVREMPGGGFSVINGVGEVRTPIFATLDQAQEAADLLAERVPEAIEVAEAEFTEAAAQRALQDNKIEETEATLAAAKETVTPLGFLSREDVGSKIASQIDRKRTLAVSLRPGETVQNDGQYTIEEVAETGASNEILSGIISKKRPVTQDPDLNVSVRDIEDLSSTKNIRFGDDAFKTFALRTTGKPMPQNMSQVQRNVLFESLDALPEFENETSIPVIKYPHFTSKQIQDVAKAIRETGKVTDKLIMETLEAPNIRGARRKEITQEVRRELIRRGALNNDGTVKVRKRLQGNLERSPAPSVKKQELLQRLEPLASAINERFQQRVKAFPELKDVRLKFNNVIDDIATGEIQQDAEGDFVTKQEQGQFFKAIRLAVNVVTDPSKSDQENIAALAEVLDHEFIHAAYDAGVVTDQEQASLESFVKKAKRPGTDGKTYYEDTFAALNPFETSEELLVEEAVAEAFRDYAAGRRVFPPKTRNIFRKIAEFFGLLKQAAADADIVTGNEIFQRLDASVNPSSPKRQRSEAKATTAPTTKLKPAERAKLESDERIPDFIEPPEKTKQKLSRKRARKVPTPVGENPFPTPPQNEIDDRLRRKGKRTDVVDAVVSTGPRNPRTEIKNDQGDVVAVVGQITFDDWINKTEGQLSDAELAEARQWYPDAAKAYQKYFGADWPNYLAAWLMANQQASPSTAAMNAVRAREQALSGVEVEVEAGLAAEKLFGFWNAMERDGELPLGGAQKLYDFIDSGLLRETRSWMGDDVRGGAPAVADVHSLRDTGFVDPTYQEFLKDNYNLNIDSDTSGSPNENQYERSADFMRSLTNYLNDIKYKGGGWTPYQVQSVGWMATTKFLGRPGQTAEDSILFNIRNLPFELAFGEGSPLAASLPEYSSLPAIGQKEVTQIAADAASDFARDVTGVAEINRVHATGGWMDDTINPNMTEQLVASPEATQDMASVLGFLLEQERMLSYRVLPKKTTKSKVALKIRPTDVSKDLLNNDTNMAILWDKLRKADLARSKKASTKLAKDRKAQPEEDISLDEVDALIQGYTSTVDENGNAAMLILLDSRGKTLESRFEPDGDVSQALARISDEIGINLEFEAAYYESELTENDWTEDQTGDGYLQRIHQRYGPAVAERVKDFKRSELEPLLKDSITSAKLKYGSGQKFSRKSPTATQEDLDTFFESMGEEGALLEYPEIGENLDQWIMNVDRGALTNALNSPEYDEYQSVLSANLERAFPSGQIPVSRTENYAVTTATDRQTTNFLVSTDDVKFAGNVDENELIVQLPPSFGYGTAPISVRVRPEQENRVDGLPATYKIPNVGSVPTEPFGPARQAARDYGQSVGRNIPDLAGNYTYESVDFERASRTGNAYDELLSSPEDGFTEAAYDALAEEVLTQYDFIKDTGLEIEFSPDDIDPYPNSAQEMVEDVKNNNHMYVSSIDQRYGEGEIVSEDVQNNPMLRLTDEYISGRQARVDDILRLVHNYFGHVKEGFNFTDSGKDAAYASHAVMFSPLARVALATETRGQNLSATLSRSKRGLSEETSVVVPPKIGILPDFVVNEGIENLVEPVDVQELRDETTFNAQGSFVPDQKFSRKYPQDPADVASNRFVKRARADGTRSDNWGKIPFAGKLLPVRAAFGRNYTTGGYGLRHASLHDEDYQGVEDLPFTSSASAIGSALDAFTQARVSGVDKSRFKFKQNNKRDSLEMRWRPTGSSTDVVVIFDRQTDDRSGQEFLGITTSYPDSEVLRDKYNREEVEKLRKGNVLGPNFAATSPTAQETVLTFKTKKPTDRPTLKLKGKAKQKFSRGRGINDLPPELQDTIRRTQAVNEEESAGQAWFGALFGDYKDSVLFSNNWQKISSAFRTQMIDKYDRISVLSGLAREVTGNLLADANAYAAVLMADYHAAITKQAWFDGVPVYDKEQGFTYVTDEVDGQTVRGLALILEPILAEGKISLFGTYAQARRAERLGKKSGMSEEDIANGLALGEMNPGFAAAFDEYQTWNSYLVKFMVDTGLITEKMGNAWIETADYTPYYRQEQKSDGSPVDMTFFYPDPTQGIFAQDVAPMDGDTVNRIPLDGARPSPELKGAGKAYQITIDNINQPEEYDSYNKARAAVRGLRQSNPDADVQINIRPRRVDDFLDNVARNTATAIQGGMKNIAAQRVIRDSLLVGLAEEVQPTKTGAKPANTVQIRVDGVDRYFEIVDNLLYASMTNIAAGADGSDIIDSVLVGYASTPARVLRELVTRDPGFMLRNMLRDSLSAWVTSGRDYLPIIDTFRGAAQVIRGDADAEAFRRAGGIGGFDFAGTPKDMAKYVESKMKTKYPSGVDEKALSPFKQLWDATTVATNASEAATRIAVYKRVLEETGNEAQAVFEGHEVLNFNRRGASSFIKILTSVTPFLNARIQGLDVLYRGGLAKNRSANPNATRRAFAVKASFIVGATALYTLFMRDLDCYKNASPEARDLNWFIPTPFDDTCVKIPVPFEVGFIFKTIPERFMQYALGDDTLRDVWQSIKRGVFSTLAVQFPQVIQPIIELKTNHSFFTGREIVPYYMQNYDADYKTYQSTSSLAKKIGKGLNISPIKIDHLIKGYTGTLGSYALSLSSSAIDAFEPADKPMPPDKSWYNLPMVRSFFQDPKGRGTVIQFYELDQLVKTATNTLKRAEKEGDIEKIKEIAESRKALVYLSDTLKNIRNNLNDIRQTKNEIIRSNIDPAKKRELLETIRLQEIAITSSIPQLRQMGFQ